MHRFFVDDGPAGLDGMAVLTDSEAHHAIHVVRLRVDADIELFDGAGREWDARVVEVKRREVVSQVRGCREIAQPSARLTLFQAWLHRDKAVEELIRHGTEIGIERFVFFPSHHSERTPRVSDKWRRTAVEACKQCRRGWLPEFATAESLDDALTRVSGTLLVATRELAPVALREAVASREVSLFVGPEGDFTEAELGSIVTHDAKAISLGDATYRSEVAAVLASTLVLHTLGLLGPS